MASWRWERLRGQLLERAHVDDLVGTKGERILTLALRDSEGDNVRAKGVCELDASLQIMLRRVG
jgi:hypothetical protein